MHFMKFELPKSIQSFSVLFNEYLKSLLAIIIVCLFQNAMISQVEIDSTVEKESNSFFSEMLKGDPFKINGSINLGMRSYNALNIDNRQSPFIWFLNTNMNIKLYKINVPVSAIISAQNDNLSHPFNQETLDNLSDRRFSRIGMSPYYKWAKLHVGHRSMHFSPLTFSNHVFLGTGVELTPGKVRFAQFYGKMAKTEPRDLSLTGFNRQVFSRNGHGMKLGYGTDRNFLDFILFKAKDSDNQIDNINQDSTSVFQNENSILAINGKATLFERVRFDLEVASSAFTQNLRDPIIGNEESSIHDFQQSRRLSTKYRKAINAAVNFDGDAFTLGAAYKRIEPEYRSLGAYFFNNDLENYTANLGFGLFSNKIRINASTGIQRNNLFDEKVNQLKRNISSVNINYFYKALNLGLNYSNYSSEISFTLNPDLDSLNAIIVTENISLNSSYSIVSSENDRHLFALNLALQSVTDDFENVAMSSESRMINLLGSYRFFPDDSYWKFNSMINYNQNELSDILIKRYGFGFGLERSLIEDKLSVLFNTVYYISSGENIDNKTLNLKFSLPYKINKKHQINFGLLYLNRTNSISVMNGDFQEITMVLNYGYRF